jgi:hypothetical protein
MNRDFVHSALRVTGGSRPVAGRVAPVLCRSSLVLAALVFGAACGEDETQRTLPSIQLAMNASVAPLYDDGEMTLIEVRREVLLPIRAPSAADLEELQSSAPVPFPRRPWITLSDVRVQLTWTLTNLDEEARTVEVLIDPWNEFGRYFPGLMAVNPDEDEYIPNLSGIDYLYRLEGKGRGEASRRHGTYTFDDMDELARDFATVMHLIAEPPAPMDDDEESNEALVYANHAFAFQNHSTRDPLVDPWLPEVIPGLVGFDLGLRTEEPATVAIEMVVEVVDLGEKKVRIDGEGTALERPEEVITLGAAP